jgi:hypothetical protein
MTSSAVGARFDIRPMMTCEKIDVAQASCPPRSIDWTRDTMNWHVGERVDQLGFQVLASMKLSVRGSYL